MATITSGAQLPETCDNYYGLLGISPFETDTRLIEVRLRELMREARKYQVGQYSARAERCMELVAQAKSTLLSETLKKKYDENLREQLGLPPVMVMASLPNRIEVAATQQAQSRWTMIGIGGGVCVLLGAFVASVMFLGDEQPDFNEGVAPVSPAGGTRTATEPPPPDLRSATQIASNTPTPERPKHPPEGTRSPPTKNPVSKTSNNETPTKTPATPTTSAGTTEPATSPATDPAPTKTGDPAPKTTPGGTTQTSTRPADPDVTKPTITGPDLGLSKSEVLSSLRVLRTSKQKDSKAWVEALRLIRFGQQAFADDKSFQRQLQTEITAQKRVFKQVASAIKD